MIPIELTIQGLYSYRKSQTIRFDQLTAAGLFGIFGGVGSGKSSLLEAITFALYGKTERLNNADNRSYNMMNLKSDKMFIEFTFKTGSPETLYKTTVSCKRVKKDFARTGSPDYKAFKQVNDEWIPIPYPGIPEIIGLSYDNFKRTIIIPQGKFQEFLQLGSTDRTRMMKELFMLERFDLSSRTATMEFRNRENITLLQGQLLQLGEVKEEDVEGLKKSIREVQASLSELQKQQELLQQEEASLKQLREMSLKLAAIQASLSTLESQAATMQLLEKNISDFEGCSLHFRNLLEREADCHQKINSLTSQIQGDDILLQATGKRITTLETDFIAIEKEYQQREAFLKRAEELGKLLQIQQLMAEQKQLQLRGTALSLEHQVLADEILRLHEEDQQARQAIEQLKEQRPDMEQLSGVKEWHLLYNQLSKNHREVTTELQEAHDALQQISLKKQQYWESPFLEDIPFETEAAALEEMLSKKPEIIMGRMALLDEQLAHLAIQSRLQDYASGLAPGSPCPLCGAIEHPNALSDQDVAEELEKLRNQKEHHKKQVDMLRSTLHNIRLLNLQIDEKQAQLQKTAGKQRLQQDALQAHQKLFQWEQYREPQAVNKAFAQARELEARITASETRVKQLQKQALEQSLLKEEKERQLNKVREKLLSITSQKDTLASQILLLDMDEYTKKTPLEISNEMEDLQQRHQGAQTRYKATCAQLDQERQTSITLSTRLELNRESLCSEQLVFEKTGNQIALQLQQTSYLDIHEVKAILSRPFDLPVEKAKIKAFRDELNIQRSREEELTTLLEGRKYDGDHHQLLLQTIKDGQQSIDTLTQEQGKLSGALEKLQKNLVTYGKLSGELALLQDRGADITTLKRLFAGSGFVEYISTIYLQELCRAANLKFFRLTRQQLSLELGSDNNFYVRDFINGGMLRNVKTLSGGQTFQAALCLALALADNIQKMAGANENFFFLDEGFGSLDKDTLQIVFETLKSLRKEQRIVGVISHVAEMQQEIDAHLMVTLDEEEGSLVRSSLE